MKKSFIILFTFYFFLSSVGIVLGKHSCGSKIAYTAWGIPVTETKGCKCRHKELPAAHKKSCCKSGTEWIKAAPSDSKIQAAMEVCENCIAPVNITIIRVLYLPVKTNYIAYSPSHSPPIPGIPLFLKNRILLI